MNVGDLVKHASRKEMTGVIVDWDWRDELGMRCPVVLWADGSSCWMAPHRLRAVC